MKRSIGRLQGVPLLRGRLLLESSGRLLLESSGRLLLESSGRLLLQSIGLRLRIPPHALRGSVRNEPGATRAPATQNGIHRVPPEA